jgi:hypothetical protein
MIHLAPKKLNVHLVGDDFTLILFNYCFGDEPQGIYGSSQN